MIWDGDGVENLFLAILRRAIRDASFGDISAIAWLNWVDPDWQIHSGLGEEALVSQGKLRGIDPEERRQKEEYLATLSRLRQKEDALRAQIARQSIDLHGSLDALRKLLHKKDKVREDITNFNDQAKTMAPVLSWHADYGEFTMPTMIDFRVCPPIAIEAEAV